MADHLMTTYARLPVTFSHGDGVWLWDTEGKKYLDALGGIAVCGLGHSHPAVTKAICDQAGKLMHTSNLYGIGVQSELADELCRLSGMEQVFFGNSGAEANEAAIKIARLFGHNKDVAVPHIIVTEGSFHGRTLSTLSATGNPKIHAGFEPLVQGFLRVPYNDVEAIARLAADRDDVVAVLVEPITGEGGISIPDANYLNELRNICDQHDLLLMLDEIQTGMCRTGQWFAHQHNNIKPDVMTLAKSLGNGMPIGACLASGKASNVFQPGNHGSTFGGNPLACSAALAVVKTMDADNLEQRATELGQKFRQCFRDHLQGVAGIKEIRTKGLMIGIELDKDCGELVSQALERGLLINVTAGNVVRLLPALITSDDEAEQIVAIVADLIRNFLSQ